MTIKSSDPYGFQFVSDWAKAVNSGEVASVVGLYEAEAVLVPTFSNTPVRGTAKIEEYFNALFSEFPDLHVEVMDGEVSQNLGGPRSLTGRYRFVRGEAIVEARYTFVVESVNGAWLVKTHHSSPNPV